MPLPISSSRLHEITSQFASLRIAVLGDFFLDKYLITNPALSEPSIETGLEARQVVEVRCNPGAAGTVTNNLNALGVGAIYAFGVIGDDGEGYELIRGLNNTRVNTERLIRTPLRFTPTYTKTMVQTEDGETEIERLDIKNRGMLDMEHQEMLLEKLVQRLTGLDGPEPVQAVVLLDQVDERNGGVITDHMRAELALLAQDFPEVLFFADSRRHIAEFHNVMIKPNRHEAAGALGLAHDEEFDLGRASEMGQNLAAKNGRAVYITLGKDGILACTPECATHMPAVDVKDPIDIVGAGDSTTAGIISSLCAGATVVESAAIGNLCASITIQKLGTTGTASVEELEKAIW